MTKIARVQLPDGRIARFEVPEDYTAEQAQAAGEAHFLQRGAEQQRSYSLNPTDGMSNTDLALAGAGKAVVDMGRGFDQLANKIDVAAHQQAQSGSPYNPLTWASKAVVAGNEALGVDPLAEQQRLQQEELSARQMDAPLMATGAGRAGNIAGNIAAAAPTVFIPGVNSYTGAALVGAGTGALQPTVEGESALKNAAIGAAGGAAGQAIGQGIGAIAKSYAAKKAAEQAAGKTANALKDSVVDFAKSEKLTIPPTQVNPSKINRFLEGFVGKVTTGQQASINNQPKLNNIIKRGLGIPEDAPLSPQALSALRAEAGKSYEVLRNAGAIEVDDAFRGDLSKIISKYQGAAKDFPELAKNEIVDTAAMLNKDVFDSSSAIDAISILRDKGDKAFRAGDKSFGKAYKEMADSMEGVIERNIEKTGAKGKELLTDYREARKLIAKTYSIESALNPATGNINAKKLGAMLDKKKPLSGDIKNVAEFAKAFKDAAEEVNRSMPGISPLDYGTAVISSAASGNSGILASIFGRPAVRSAILSGPYQSAMVNSPSYAPTLLQKSAPLLQSDVTNALLRSAPASIYFGQ